MEATQVEPLRVQLLGNEFQAKRISFVLTAEDIEALQPRYDVSEIEFTQ